MLYPFRRLDYEHYLCGLLMPPKSREAYFAIRAFNIETAIVREVASNPVAGKMRIEWWKQTIKDIYKVSRTRVACMLVCLVLFWFY